MPDNVKIVLPDLTGDYDSGFIDPNDAPRVRVSSFSIPQDVLSLNNMRVVMSGSNEDGSMYCEYEVGGVVYRDTMSMVTQMRLVLTAPTLDGGCFFGIVNLLMSTWFSTWRSWPPIAGPGEKSRLSIADPRAEPDSFNRVNFPPTATLLYN